MAEYAERPENEPFARAFAHALTRSGLSAARFGEALGEGEADDVKVEVSEDQIYRMVHERTIVPAWLFRRAARKVGMTMDELYAAGNGLKTPIARSAAVQISALQGQLEAMIATLQRMDQAIDAERLADGRRS